MEPSPVQCFIYSPLLNEECTAIRKLWSISRAPDPDGEDQMRASGGGVGRKLRLLVLLGDSG